MSSPNLHRWLLPAFGVLFAIACSEAALRDGGIGPEEPSADAGRDGGFNFADGGLNAQNACALINAEKCKYLQQCGLIEDGESALRDCASILVTTECGPSLWPARVSVGTLRFSSTLAGACAASYSARHCQDYATAPELCGKFLTPGSGLSSACYGGPWQECSSGICRGLSCPRTCRAPGNVGEDCSADQDCLTDGGLYCLPSGNGTSGLCALYGGADAGCNALSRCGSAYFCNQAGHCEALHQQGESCTDGTCVPEQWCATTADGGTCTFRQFVNSDCTDDRQCGSGLICVPQPGAMTGKCWNQGPLGSGTACGYGQQCASGLTCVGLSAQTLGSCAEPVAVGKSCVGTNDCQAHLSCLPADASTDLRCTPRRDDGAPCSEDRDCLLYSACKSGSCFRLPRIGEPCTSATECIYGSCTEQSDGGSICSGLLAPNATCSFDSECSSGRCAAGSCLAACVP